MGGKDLTNKKRRTKKANEVEVNRNCFYSLSAEINL